MTTTYTLAIKTSADIPSDVIIEHVGYALRGIVDPARRLSDDVSVTLIGKKNFRSHPFEGPEVNDDLPGSASGVMEVTPVVKLLSEEFPRLMELLAAKRENQVHVNFPLKDGLHTGGYIAPKEGDERGTDR